MTRTDAIKAGLWTALFTFVALFGASLLGWISDVVEWAGESGTGTFPDVTVLGKAAIAAAGAALAGLVNVVVRLGQVATGHTTGPTYKP